MHNKPLITIGVLNYNGLTFLEETVPCLLGLTYKPIEVIVLDNGSTDGSVEFLHSFKELCLIENKENAGYGAGKNTLVKQARGEYILLLDNDVKLGRRDIIQSLLSFYKNKLNISFLSVPLIDHGKIKTEHYGLYYSSIKRDISVEALMRMEPFIPGGFIGGFVFFKKQIFIELGMYDTVYPFNIDDYDLSARSWLAGYRIYILPTVQAEHIGITTRTNKKSWCWKNTYALSGFGRMVLKNYRLINILVWLPLMLLWFFYKSLRASWRFKSPDALKSYFVSFGLFVRDIPSTLKLRRDIQARRNIFKDIFLFKQPPQ
jgi:GT2 family glycosyltransferase